MHSVHAVLLSSMALKNFSCKKMDTLVCNMVHVVRNTLSRHIVNIGTAAPLGQYLAKK